MAHAIASVICLTVLAAYGVTVYRLHEKSTVRVLLPAVFFTFTLILLELVLIYYPASMQRGMKLLLLNQVLLCPAWLIFSMFYARPISFIFVSRLDKLLLAISVLPLLFALILPVSSFYYQTDFSVERVLFLERESFFFYLLMIVLLLLSVGNLESTLRNSQHSEQWRIKLALVGTGLLIGSLVLFYSQGLLSRAVNMNNLPLRNSGIAFGLLLMLYAEWRRQSANVVISRKIAFRSFVAAIAGVYLMGLGFAREGSRIFGNDATQVLLLMGVAALVLCSILLALSQSFRRKVSIWIQRTLYDEKYDYRRQWMLFSERLSTSGDKDSLIRSALLSFCDTFGRVGAYFIPVDQDSLYRVGPGVYYEIEEKIAGSIPPEYYTELLNLPPTPVSADKHSSSVFTGKMGETLALLQVGLFMPIQAADEPEGLLFLGAPIDGKEKYDTEDFELMEAMGRQVGVSIRSFRLTEELVTAKEMEVVGRIGTFVLHDLKNQVYALSLLTDNAKKFIKQEEFQHDMLETLSNTVANMKILITQLTHLPTEAHMRIELVDLSALAHKVCSQIPSGNVQVTGKNIMVAADAEQIGKVLTNLCLNAVEAGGDKPVKVEVAQEGVPVLRVRDEGGGIAEDIMQSGLFKPFHSTKARGMGIGLYHTRKIVEAHGAKISVENRPGEGCTFTIRFEGENKAKAAANA